VTQQKTAEHTH